MATFSKGHLFMIGSEFSQAEFYSQGGQIFRASTLNPLDVDGYRQGGRWECADTPTKRAALEQIFEITISGDAS